MRWARLVRTRRPVTFNDKVRYKLLRDHRNNKVAEMDPELLLLLTQLNGKLENNKELHIISGYRSPESNATALSSAEVTVWA